MVWGETCGCECVWLCPSPPPHFKVGNQLKASWPPPSPHLTSPSVPSIKSADPSEQMQAYGYDSVGMFCITWGGGLELCFRGVRYRMASGAQHTQYEYIYMPRFVNNFIMFGKTSICTCCVTLNGSLAHRHLLHSDQLFSVIGLAEVPISLYVTPQML